MLLSITASPHSQLFSVSRLQSFKRRHISFPYTTDQRRVARVAPLPGVAERDLRIVRMTTEGYTSWFQRESRPGGIAVANHFEKLYRPLVQAVMLLVGCWLLLSATALGQVGNGSKIQRQEMEQRELQLSDKGRVSHRELDARDRALMQEMNEDFQRLLKLHNEIVRTIANNDPPNYQFISEAAGEIKKRAAHLQATLGLGKPETAERKREGQNLEAQLGKDDLVVLCKKIESFITNPIIEVPGTINARQLERARQDLESVVRLSGDIKKSAAKQKH